MPLNMGIGKLGDTQCVFIRKFRFLLFAENLENDWVKAVDIQWTNKLLTIKGYEVCLSPENIIPIHVWADAMEKNEYPNETLTLVLVDGCGLELKRYKFSGLKILNRRNSFNYESSEESLHEICISYEKHENLPIESLEHTVATKEETKIDHLNSRIYIP